MDNREGRTIVEQIVSQRKQQTYEQWLRIVGQGPEVENITGPSGCEYCVEIEPRWDAAPGGTVRVMFAIDDGGMSAFAPMTFDFLIDADGTIK